MTDKVREEFEKRFYPTGTDVQSGAMVEALFEVYKAGRESMRAEAMQACLKITGGSYRAIENAAERIKELP